MELRQRLRAYVARKAGEAAMEANKAWVTALGLGLWPLADRLRFLTRALEDVARQAAEVAHRDQRQEEGDGADRPGSRAGGGDGQ